MDVKLCPVCDKVLDSKNDGTYNYDPVVYVEIVLYYCPACGYHKQVEYLKQIT